MLRDDEELFVHSQMYHRKRQCTKRGLYDGWALKNHIYFQTLIVTARYDKKPSNPLLVQEYFNSDPTRLEQNSEPHERLNLNPSYPSLLSHQTPWPNPRTP